MIERWRAVLFVMALVIVAVAGTGCGGKKAKVTGKLTWNTTPVTATGQQDKLLVYFYPADEAGKGRQPVQAAVDRQSGTFEAVVPAGKYRIAVQKFTGMQEQFNNSFAGGKSPIVRDVSADGQIELDLASEMMQRR